MMYLCFFYHITEEHILGEVNLPLKNVHFLLSYLLSNIGISVAITNCKTRIGAIVPMGVHLTVHSFFSSNLFIYT